jgi:aryl-alcohol dehydrogenase-like predicted oxidoreductase
VATALLGATSAVQLEENLTALDRLERAGAEEFAGLTL